jgi:hypothetical protein
MSDQKNKQQQPQGNQKNQGSEKDQNKSGQQSGGGQPGSGQQTPHNTAQKSGGMDDTHKQKQPVGSEIENPDQENDPDKKVNISDDPDQTKKKVPNMHKDH